MQPLLNEQTILNQGLVTEIDQLSSAYPESNSVQHMNELRSSAYV